MSLLKVSHLEKTYPPLYSLFGRLKQPGCRAVKDVSFTLEEGEILGLLGKNGAGKTTIINMLLSILEPTGGDIQFFGMDLKTHRSPILQHVGYASAYVKFPGHLTINENLHISARLMNVPSGEIDERIKRKLSYFGMWHLRDKEISSLSAGQITRVMLAKAFVSRPKIVLLDEPTASLDPDVARDVRNFMLQQKHEEQVSFLLTSHNMIEVAEVCDRILVIKDGTIIANNSPAELVKEIALAHVRIIPAQMDAMKNFLVKSSCQYSIEGREVTIELDEHAIAAFLMELSRAGIEYTNIFIDQPSLEDYFIQVFKK
jgi:ABC-2 type transport system ATP-binding protein